MEASRSATPSSALRPPASPRIPALLLLLSMTTSSSDASSARNQEDQTSPSPDAPAHEHRPPLPSPEEIAALPPDGGSEFNRLVFSRSPYLLQHARNPVDWYPWGEEAFARARAEDKPIFLSIGYSTCHWCHVMEHESFEDEEVAALMNEHFVCVKVDREERPDIDQIYMSVTQRVTGSGGWPMTVVMTPTREPFFCGTYFPKRSRFQRPGMMELVPRISEFWKTRRKDALELSRNYTQILRSERSLDPLEKIDASLLASAYEQLSRRFDSEYGGFSERPKFPVPHNLTFLLQTHNRTKDGRALLMVEKTLEEMRKGGIFDHVGYGFHRYSTDREWLVPHFEKMLYDQALLTLAYAAAFQVTGKEPYERTAREILTYVERDMTDPEGGFYSAEDADSEGEEGLFYVWTLEELTEVLGTKEAALYARVHEMSEEGNFLEESTGQRTGSNIPHLRKDLGLWAAELDLELDELEERLEAARARLFEHREARIHPLKDDKILTDWNGLMIAAFTQASLAFDDEHYLGVARRAADFALGTLMHSGNRLYKRYRLGEAGLPGTLEDHAFLAWGLVDLYEACFDTRYLEAAIQLTDAMVEHFEDSERGGFFLNADDAEELLVRPKEIYDGAIPSGNSVAARNLLRLGRITGNTTYEEKADRTLRAFPEILRGPSAYAMLMSALDFAVGPSFEIVVAGEAGASDTREMLRAFQSRYLPHKVLLHRPPGDGSGLAIAELAPFTAAQGPIGGKATAYVCRDYACKKPTSEITEALKSLEPEAWE